MEPCSCVAIPVISEAALSYYKSGNILWILSHLFIFCFPLLFFIKKFSLKCEKFSELCFKNWPLGAFVYLFIYQLFSLIFFFPLEFYTGFTREKSYGLSNQSLMGWFLEYLKGAGVDFCFFTFFVLMVYALIRISRKKWWLYGALISIGFSIFSIIIQPVLIDPLFNQFTPMKNKVLEEQILKLASKAGIENSKVFEVDKSAQTNLLNAYVTGGFGTSRIVLWDTLLKKMSPSQTLFVMGHEMGHYVLSHIILDLIFSSMMSFGIFYFIFKSSAYLIKKYPKLFLGITIEKIGSLPLLILLTQFAFFMTSPLSLGFSRYLEHQADIFGLEITQNNQAAAEAFVILQSSNLANPNPGPLYKFFRASHPTLSERITFCNEYCPWKKNKELKYEDHFKNL